MRFLTFETFDQSDEETWPDQQKDNEKDKYNDNDKYIWRTQFGSQFRPNFTISANFIILDKFYNPGILGIPGVRAVLHFLWCFLLRPLFHLYLFLNNITNLLPSFHRECWTAHIKKDFHPKNPEDLIQSCQSLKSEFGRPHTCILVAQSLWEGHAATKKLIFFMKSFVYKFISFLKIGALYTPGNMKSYNLWQSSRRVELHLLHFSEAII